MVILCNLSYTLKNLYLMKFWYADFKFFSLKFDGVDKFEVITCFRPDLSIWLSSLLNMASLWK